MEQSGMESTSLQVGTRLECIEVHEDGFYTVGEFYRVNAHRYRSVPGGGLNCAGIRVRDDKRERKDFNFIPTSKNYIWKFFRLVK
jgi:hypothetical protein